MADQYPMNPAPGRPVGTPAPAPAPTAHRPPRFPEDPDAARAEIAATRARMSNTIDELEGALLRKKEEIRDRLDVLEPVREQPLRSIAILFGAALAFGFLTGGGGKRKETEVRYVLANGVSDDDGVDEDIEEEDDEAEQAWERAELWEDRAHRLLRIAQTQEAELELHRSRREQLRDRLRSLRRAEAASEVEEEVDYEDGEEGTNLLDRVKIDAASRLASIAEDVSRRFMRGA